MVIKLVNRLNAQASETAHDPLPPWDPAQPLTPSTFLNHNIISTAH